MIEAIMIGLVVIIIVQNLIHYYDNRKKQDMYEQNLMTMTEYFSQALERWADERKQLLDRIQAPSFAEYANKVIREKKAGQPEEKTDTVEFVS